MINIDIQTKILNRSQKIWVVFSGKRRQYYNTFRDNNIVFLDYPGLNLFSTSVSSQELIRRHVRMSNAIAAYEREEFNLNPPSEDINYYSDAPFKDHSSRVKTANIRKLYGKLTVGDLIVVPGGPFDPLLFGEIDQLFDPADRISIKTGEVVREIQFRSVKWTRTDVIRSEIPVKLQTYLSKPPAISEILRKDDLERLYPFAYESYIFGNASYEFIRAPSYSGNDPRETEDANRLVSYFIAAFWAIEKGEIENFVSLDFDSAIEDYYNPDLLTSYVQVFRSPGHIGILAAAASLACFVATCTTLSVNNIAVSKIKSGIVIENSASQNLKSSVERDVETRVNQLMKSLSEKELKTIKKKGERARKNLGIKTKSVLK